MSLHDSNVLVALYDGLATPPISPTNSATGRSRNVFNSFRHTWTPHTPAHTVPSTPINRSPTDAKPTPKPIVAINAHLIHASPPTGSLLPTRLPHPPPLNRLPTRVSVQPPADSLTREKKGKMPTLSHLLSVGGGRVLSLAADEHYVYAGCQSMENEITVFSRTSLQPMYKLLGHEGSVLALMVVEGRNWLVSSSSAGDIRIWSTETLQPIYIIHPCDDTAGDIHSLAWDDRDGGTLYIGSQSASIEWVTFADTSCQGRPVRTRKPSLPTTSGSLTVPVNGPSPNGEPSNTSNPPRPNLRTGRYRPHKFFDDHPSASGSSTPKINRQGSRSSYPSTPTGQSTPTLPEVQSEVIELEITSESRLAFAHYGYVYALYMIPRPDGSAWLVSGSGDSDVKIWAARPRGGLKLLQTFSGLHGAVHSFAVRDSLLFAGLQEGEIVVWDLETKACVRSIEAHDSDVLSMSVLGDDVYTAAADGRVLRVDEAFDCTAAWRAHSGIILSTTVVKAKQGWELITAGNDSFVKIWSIEVPQSLHQDNTLDKGLDVESDGDVMLYALSKLVAVRTVSDEKHRESCRQGAHLLKKILQQLGAQSEVLSGQHGKNPLVLATFEGRDTGKPRKRLLFYGKSSSKGRANGLGHYDVQPAEESRWETDPWSLSGRNGYLYGRGVTDNKGPILAVACAAAALRQRRELDVDLVMIIEGEEEAGSTGFASTVRKNKDLIGHIDAVLLSNSTWIDENDPCVVFGMRGVVYAKLSVFSHGNDAHSGVDGGAVEEPMMDMVKLLSAVADKQSVKLPGFYDSVRPVTEEELAILKDVSTASGRPVEDLKKVWREPSFSIANIASTGSTNKTVIPKRVTADISMRIVPDQELKVITEGLEEFCKKTFEDLGSENGFEVDITHAASWWLASLDSPYFKALESAVEDVWGVKPLKIREGGTVPTIFWLEQEFKAPCVHLPLGQASDAGHLANERMRLLNLRNGKRVVESYLTRLAKQE